MNRTPIDGLVPFRDALPIIGRRATAAYGDIKAGRLKVIKNGRRTFVRASEIERYIAALEAEGGRCAA
jgi:hypothetical protein